MARNFDDWLTAFIDYAKFGEAPKRMYFWAGVSAIAGALRRKVWIDQAYFRWYPNMYIVFVAPPGVVSKTTTVSTAISLLRKVPGIKFGPDVVTWQSLVKSFAEASELFQVGDEFHTMSSLTLESGEFGNLLNPQDRDMVDLLVSLWDGKQGNFIKETKTSGNDSIENPWINLIACTTPAWIAGNFPDYMIGGGFTSRCVFVYADAKERYVAYPARHVPADMHQTADRLVQDLEDIAINCVGQYHLTHEAMDWGEEWYRKHYSTKPVTLSDERFGGYLARKQTLMHKLAMIVAASSSNHMEITSEHLSIASTMLTDLEPDMAMVFSKIGKTDVSNHADRLVHFLETNGETLFKDAYKQVHAFFPSLRDFEDVLQGCIKAGLIKVRQVGNALMLSAGGSAPPPGAAASPDHSPGKSATG